MSDAAKRFTVTFVVPEWWEQRRQAKALRQSGRTSIRVSKDTLAALRALTLSITGEKAEDLDRGWRRRRPSISPDELLAFIARGTVRRRHANRDPETHASHDRETHASVGSAESMPSAAVDQVKRHASSRPRKGMRSRRRKGMPRRSRKAP